MQAAPPPPPKGRVHPIVWVLVGMAGLLLVVVVGLVIGGIFVAKRFADNPLETAAAVITTANPNIEVVGTNRDSGTVTFREKTSGKSVTVDLDQLKSGKLVFSSEGGAIGLPNWFPAYPGATMSGSEFSAGTGGASATVEIDTRDTREQVLDYYEQHFKKEGFHVTRPAENRLEAEMPARRREASVKVESARVILSFTAKD